MAMEYICDGRTPWEGHRHREARCPRCGWVFCRSCCENYVPDEGENHLFDFMICPECGQEYCSDERI